MSAMVSAIVVAADSGPSLHKCIASVLASTAAVEVVIVDNGSRDGVPEALARAHEQDERVRVVYNHANLGFGPAANIGARNARGDPLLVLNPDCVLDPGTLAQLLAVLGGHAGAGLVGAVTCDEDGTPDPASRRRDPLLHRSLNELTGRTRHAHEGVDVAGPIPATTIEVENVSGALMLIPRPMFERVHGFDEGYFLHFEDLDLCRRVRDAGYKVLLAGGVRVRHAKGGSSAHRPVFVSYHKHRGMWRWFRKFDVASQKPFVRALVACGIAAHFMATAPGLWLRRSRRH